MHIAKYVFMKLLFNPFYYYAKNVILCSRHLVSGNEQEKKVAVFTINWCTPTVNKVKNHIGKYLNFFCSPYWTHKYRWNWNVLHESPSHRADLQDRAINALHRALIWIFLFISHPWSRTQVETKILKHKTHKLFWFILVGLRYRRGVTRMILALRSMRWWMLQEMLNLAW